jgi:hypothetical protein
MSEPTPPPWDDDPLSTVLFHAARNERVSSLRFPDIYELFQRFHTTFNTVAENTANDQHDHLLPARFLLARAHAAFLASVRLAMSGQIVEVQMTLRGVIEAAWYALHIARDPQRPDRAKIWLGRGKDKDATDRCRTEFSIGNVRATHEALDRETAANIQTLYNWTIDLGAHPNVLGALSGMTRADQSDRLVFNAVVLSDSPPLVVTALKLTSDAAIGALKTLELAFPERFAITGLDVAIVRLAQLAGTIFQRYAAKFQERGGGDT